MYAPACVVSRTGRLGTNGAAGGAAAVGTPAEDGGAGARDTSFGALLAELSKLVAVPVAPLVTVSALD